MPVCGVSELNEPARPYAAKLDVTTGVFGRASDSSLKGESSRLITALTAVNLDVLDSFGVVIETAPVSISSTWNCSSSSLLCVESAIRITVAQVPPRKSCPKALYDGWLAGETAW